ncbi:hypothetical protein FSP39_008584 [Pinctada imbricata]|uniref:Uncharacterized protein n=1 Tax=Pinctada imbricata TaxID=66713 RepID=A0AA88YBL3_PINIB|nr:hypothetical protein FSP39_008584 [Pinctada imbricata]
MGKSSKKRKEAPPSDDSANDSITVSKILNDTNSILYGTSMAPGPSSASTPKPADSGNAEGALGDAPQQEGAPPWAKDLILKFNALQVFMDVKLNEVTKKLASIDILEKRVNSLDTKIAKFDGDIRQLQAEVAECVKQSKNAVDSVCERTEFVEFELKNMSDRIKHLEDQNKAMKFDIIDMKARSMRDNLLFSGIAETPGETPNTTESILRKFLVDNLHMDTGQVNDIKFDRVHRLNGSTSPRVIIAKFGDYKQREMVRHLSKELRGTRFYINEHFPAEVNDQRRELIQVMKEERRKGKTCRLVYNKLYIDNLLYRPGVRASGSHSRNQDA